MNKVDKSKYLIATPHDYPDWMTGAYKEAKEFAGTSGHIASISELVKMRLEEKILDAPPWLFGLTGRNVMYFGMSCNNKPVLIVTKDKIGPLKNITGIRNKYFYPDSSCGIISRKEFAELENEKVEKIQLEKYINEASHLYRFASTSINTLFLDEILFSLFSINNRNYTKMTFELMRQSLCNNSMSAMASTVQYKIFPKNFVNDLFVKIQTGFFNNSALAVLPTLTSYSDLKLYGSLISFNKICDFTFVGIKK